jgi:hypothetical protein
MAAFAEQAYFLPGRGWTLIDLREKLIYLIGSSHGKIVMRLLETIKLSTQIPHIS